MFSCIPEYLTEVILGHLKTEGLIHSLEDVESVELRENGQKAYEMMSCYEGLLELYKVTGNPLYLSVVEKTVGHIVREEINVAGSGSAFECWYGGKERQTQPTYHTMETCVTFTWMQLCNRLLQMTGNSLYADYMETAIYNALMASLKADASQIAKYSPLEGWRHEGEEQCGMHINCCNANGPRAFAMIPQFAYQVQDDCVRGNFYAIAGQETGAVDINDRLSGDGSDRDRGRSG